ncbi:hypothetical protein FB566_4037 [Stackebrandtia endophytica]|uniref:Uncharacterized protein n=1 Tax=Stackebrandtia endophytica TaxID=1496996 RepID=A0A543B0V7_9ACTN|nr:hypothetical protein [Stackebrandtia endophytica]TQL78449.1 hypothetical protein FB566_4037 [Stackebrandtia endophytica]
MTVQPNHRALLKAMALGDTRPAIELSETIPADEESSYHMLVTALFCVMLGHRFDDVPTRDAIVEFVNEMRFDYRDADPAIKPLAIEVTIRASLGEEDLLDEIAPADTLTAEYQVIRKIVLQSPEVTAEIDRFLDESEGIATQWLSEEAAS